MVGIGDESALKSLYEWVDRVPLSRPKRNFSRDFSDGVLTAEIIMHYFPRMIDVHNYSPASGTRQKIENWHLLNRKVFSRFGFEVADDLIRQVADCKPMAAEHVLQALRSKINQLLDDPPSRTQPRVLAQAQQVQNAPSSLFLPPIVTPSSSSTASHHGRPHVLDDLLRGERRTLLPTGERAQQLLLEYEETIQILQAKVHRLEHLLQLKDSRIDDLQSKLDAVLQAVGRRA